MKISFFDFDGTITRKDSFFEFLKFSNSFLKLSLGAFVLCPILTGYAFGLIPNGTAKQKVFSWFFKGKTADEFSKMATDFARQNLSGIVKKSALDRIQWHKDQGHKIAVVSASLEAYLSDWCQTMGLDLIGTKVEMVGGKVSGQFLTPNCFGIEKVNRIKEKFCLGDFDYIYAYGDSRGDKEMLELANEKYYCFFS